MPARRVSWEKVLAVVMIAAALCLLASFNPVWSSASEGIILAWLAASLLVLVAASTYVLWILIDTLRRRTLLGARFDTLFWIAFIVLPILAWLLYVVAWNLKEALGV